MRDEFAVHRLNDKGMDEANQLGELFSLLLHSIEQRTGTDGLEVDMVRLKLQEASYFAKRAIAKRSENQLDSST